jgi:hypothetical protein
VKRALKVLKRSSLEPIDKKIIYGIVKKNPLKKR